MLTRVLCPACQYKIEVPEEKLGKRRRCPNCETPFVPGTSASDAFALKPTESVASPFQKTMLGESQPAASAYQKTLLGESLPAVQASSPPPPLNKTILASADVTPAPANLLNGSAQGNAQEDTAADGSLNPRFLLVGIGAAVVLVGVCMVAIVVWRSQSHTANNADIAANKDSDPFGMDGPNQVPVIPEPPTKLPTVTVKSIEPDVPRAGGPVLVRLEGTDAFGLSPQFEYRTIWQNDWRPAPGGCIDLAMVREGRLTLEIRARDDKGLLSRVLVHEINVAAQNRPPTVAIDSVSPENPMASGPFTVKLKGDDPDRDPIEFEYRFDPKKTSALVAPNPNWRRMVDGSLDLRGVRAGAVGLEFRAVDSQGLSSEILRQAWLVSGPLSLGRRWTSHPVTSSKTKPGNPDRHAGLKGWIVRNSEELRGVRDYGDHLRGPMGLADYNSYAQPSQMLVVLADMVPTAFGRAAACYVSKVEIDRQEVKVHVNLRPPDETAAPGWLAQQVDAVEGDLKVVVIPTDTKLKKKKTKN